MTYLVQGREGDTFVSYVLFVSIARYVQCSLRKLITPVFLHTVSLFLSLSPLPLLFRFNFRGDSRSSPQCWWQIFHRGHHTRCCVRGFLGSINSGRVHGRGGDDSGSGSAGPGTHGRERNTAKLLATRRTTTSRNRRRGAVSRASLVRGRSSSCRRRLVFTVRSRGSLCYSAGRRRRAVYRDRRNFRTLQIASFTTRVGGPSRPRRN